MTFSRFLVGLLALTLAACAGTTRAPVSPGRVATTVETTPNIAPRPRPRPPPRRTGGWHTVGVGETLFGVARQYGIAPEELAAWNDISDPDRLQVGRQLRLSPSASDKARADKAVAAAPVAGVRPIAIGAQVEARPLDPVDGAAPGVVLQGSSASFKRGPKGGKLPYSSENLALLRSRAGVFAAARPASPPPSQVKAEPQQQKPPPPPTKLPEGDIVWAWPAQGEMLKRFSEGGDGVEANKGIDIAGVVGDKVFAAAAGKVIHVGNGEIRGLGKFVVVKHSRKYLSVYGNNSRVLVKQNQMVKLGDVIAEVGDSDAKRPKLHFEVRERGKPVDPLRFLPRR